MFQVLSLIFSQEFPQIRGIIHTVIILLIIEHQRLSEQERQQSLTKSYANIPLYGMVMLIFGWVINKIL